ncbi:MAG TPA: DUF481 domain-containing protein [Phycisphaerales bacterium]|nr:DUF481 domain-containing protein [Phycisphaerales bacterium]HIB49707.1 DUF481 domain-containing protein [Phycisphaerales bacterium]HIN84582.1 DUF481 domain-containing protein [Phycisphaerales bacterium]HIO20696.1 DUF481 domain-containing protein [Phycisphaerales bacterium]HIO52733.1 DUF481 domain-containing protein [Phycisphaerales bacterium]
MFLDRYSTAMTQHIYSLASIFILSLTVFGDVIVLTSGEQLEGTIKSQDGQFVHVQHAILGDISIELKNITTLNGERLPESSAIAPDEEPEENHDDTLWNQSINVGLGIQNGQKNTSDLSTAYHADRTKDEHKVAFDIRYKMSKTDGERTLNRFASSWGNTWYQTDSPWDVFTTLQFDWAEFQSWDQRLVGDLGVEYEVLKTIENNEEFTLTLRLGSGFRKEFQSNNDHLIPEGLLGVGVNWVVSDKQTLTASTTWYPDYDDVSNYRLVTNASWNLQMSNIENIQFSIGFHHEYNSQVDAGVDNSDLQLTAGINYSF